MVFHWTNHLILLILVLLGFIHKLILGLIKQELILPKRMFGWLLEVGLLMGVVEVMRFLGQIAGKEWPLEKIALRMVVVLTLGGQTRIRTVTVSLSPGLFVEVKMTLQLGRRIE